MKIRRTLSVIIFLFVVFINFSESFDHNNPDFEIVLKKFVQSGNFDYKGLKKESELLTIYLEKLSAVTQTEYDSFTENEKIAFLVNAYNAFTIQLILNNYPLKSIGDIGRGVRSINIGLGKPWNLEFFELLGQKRNLNWIEHSKLRIDFNEPRIHFAINCASIGCPALLNESYKSTILDEQLNSSLNDFLLTKSKNYYDEDKKILYLSKIFDWFKDDFIKKSGSVVDFIKPHFQSELPDNIKIKFTNYDWLLNEPIPKTQL